MSTARNSEDEDKDGSRSADAYIIHFKKNSIDSWKWQKNTFKETKRALRIICIHVPAEIGRAKDLTDNYLGN
ncbi:hypothetical protein NPIL_592881, partial [Nephila pilipes]